MSVYKHKNSPYYQYDFQVGGERFHGSTGEKGRRAAEQKEALEKQKAKKAAKAAKAAKGGPLTIDAAASRYWEEIGQHHANAETTNTDLERLVGYFGETKLMTDITDNDVSELVRWRRSQRAWGKEEDAAGKPMRFVSAATVNRSTTLVLKTLFTRSKVWRYTFPDEPIWKDHWLEEPRERVRELKKSEGSAIELATREDYEPVFAYERATGVRMNECLIKWENVDWDTGRIETIGKGGKVVRTAITPTVKEILAPLVGHHPEWVFTYRAQRTIKGNSKTPARIKGHRYPITYDGLKSQWKRIRKKAAVENFRFHDFRHDVGTKLLRMTGNLKTVQKALNHSDIKTTTRYAHVLDEEVAADLEKLARSQRRKKRTDAKQG